MKLTKRVKATIVLSFKRGDEMTWLAALYEQPIKRIEAVIREALKKQDQDEG